MGFLNFQGVWEANLLIRIPFGVHSDTFWYSKLSKNGSEKFENSNVCSPGRFTARVWSDFRCSLIKIIRNTVGRGFPARAASVHLEDFSLLARLLLVGSGLRLGLTEAIMSFLGSIIIVDCFSPENRQKQEKSVDRPDCVLLMASGFLLVRSGSFVVV